jgi:hypothetical protein
LSKSEGQGTAHPIQPARQMIRPTKMIGVVDQTLDTLNLLHEIVPEHFVSCGRTHELNLCRVVVK